MAYTQISLSSEVVLLIFIRNITSPLIFYFVIIGMGITGNLFNDKTRIPPSDCVTITAKICYNYRYLLS